MVWRIAGDAGSQGIAQAAADGQPEPHWSLAQLLKAGMLMNEPALNLASEAGTPVTVVDLPTPGRPTEYTLGTKNFYVLTRYNRSFFYALAVYQLGRSSEGADRCGRFRRGAFIGGGGAVRRLGRLVLVTARRPFRIASERPFSICSDSASLMNQAGNTPVDR